MTVDDAMEQGRSKDCTLAESILAAELKYCKRLISESEPLSKIEQLRDISAGHYANFKRENETAKELKAEVEALRRELKRIVDFRWKREPHFKADGKHYWYAYEVARKAIGAD